MIAERINAERLVLLGWSRAIALQMAHPLVAAGVADHSHFRAGPLEAATRLRETVRAMLALTFGDPIAHGHAIAGIRAIHTRVHGRLRHPTGTFEAGTPYSAEDPALVLWVHATLIESVVLVYERLIAPLAPAERDQYCAEAADVAKALGAREEDLPRSWAALEFYLAAELTSGRIEVGADARAIIDAVLFPPLSWVSGPAAWINRLVTIGLLPDRIRAGYRYGWSDRRERQLRRVMAALRAVRHATPRALAYWRPARAAGAAR